MYPRGSRYLIIKELGLKDHDYYGLGGLSPFNNLVSGPHGYCTTKLVIATVQSIARAP